jgi:hypothetical protein
LGSACEHDASGSQQSEWFDHGLSSDHSCIGIVQASVSRIAAMGHETGEARPQKRSGRTDLFSTTGAIDQQARVC